MRKKRWILIMMAIALSMMPLTGCKEKKAEIVDDNYRNVYEIFVASFNDSDGDKVGDLNGVTAKLDYIQDMGYTAIWFMPIHPSPSYHKYDVTDYYGIDEAYGTMEDFDKLVAEAHKRDINIILDLVVNHSSSSHPWFLSAKTAYVNNKESEYLDWYNFTDHFMQGYAKINNTAYYEARFVDSMPDLNLSNEEVRAEIVKIMKFWLDKGVDGFRLDAVTSYYTGNHGYSTDFINWLNTEAKKIKEDCYIVGECWESDSVIKQYYTSGADSFFQFSMSQGDGTIAKCLKVTSPARYYKNAMESAWKLAGTAIPAIFLDNHDVNRITGGIGRSKTAETKMAYGLAAMIGGCIYTYYGTEIGMVGSGKDENKRIAMLWDSDDTSKLCKNPAGATQSEYAYPGVKQQQSDKNSLLNYHKTVNNLRNKYPSIARGTAEFVDSLSSDDVLVLKKTWNEETIVMVINLHAENTYDINLESLGSLKLGDYAAAKDSKTEYKGNVLAIGPYTIAILTGGK